ncbi:asparagine synthase (glutamine-hydrolyzing) [Kiloniella laminariae]|uniref:asparagine synthase (glutamine-hydrolyzing) n=1 Tax=Kiloniella laminariae TaxID=454162 RepID=UPI000367A142|nr:asparagine synthase (glutamine-hydrolyzing) [Kiloniella laminariae]
MCGIAGYIKISSAELDTVKVLNDASKSIQHRGPDATGFGIWAKGQGIEINNHTSADFATKSPDVAFIHKRLAIIDTSTNGDQPIKSQDNRYLLIQNGEIYNYIELREELKKLGHVFHTESDTEVLLKSYIQWNCNAFERFIGMFAVAILDTESNEVILARDFFGIKPLFYTQTNNNFFFGSEIKSLLKFPGVRNKPNLSSVRDYLSLGLVNHNQDSFYASIKSINPGHYLKINLNTPQNVQIYKYYNRQTAKLTTKEISFQDAAQHLRKLFLESVQLHMRSDVPYGAALSGGVDSSAITAAMRIIGGSKANLQTFTYSTKNTTFDEESYADIMIQRAKTTSHKITLKPQNLLADLDKILHTQDEPFGSTSIYAQYKIFEEANNAGIKVILGGQGADEILAGYRSYYTAAVAGLIKSGQIVKALNLTHSLSKQGKVSLSNFLFRVITRLCPPVISKEIHRIYAETGINSTISWKWFEDNGVIGEYTDLPGTAKSLHQALEGDLSYFNLPGLLRYEDRNSMAHSLESRVPFVTPTIVDFVSSLPDEYLIDKNGQDKAVFRAAMRSLVPDEILDRTDKIGFQTPETDWFREITPWIRQTLKSDYFQDLPFFKTKDVKQCWQSFEEGHIEFPRSIWRWVNLAKWAEMNGLHFNE